jgi:hypothetical protein
MIIIIIMMRYDPRVWGQSEWGVMIGMILDVRRRCVGGACDGHAGGLWQADGTEGTEATARAAPRPRREHARVGS